MPVNKLLIWAACAVVLFSGVCARAQSVVVVSSDRSAAYTQAGLAASASLALGGIAQNEIAQKSLDEWQDDSSALPAPHLFITLGSEALRQVLATNPKAHVLAALIPRSGYQRVVQEFKGRDSNVTALYLDQPLSRQVELIRTVMPRARKVATLWGAESLQLRPDVAAQLGKSGLALSEQRVEGGNLAKAIRQVLEDADVLLALPDAQVFNSATVANVLLAAYHARVPMIAFSPAYVKAGALMALYSTPEQIGTQAGVIGSALLAGKHVDRVYFPSEFVVAVNDNVARSLGYALDPVEVTRLLHRQEGQP